MAAAATSRFLDPLVLAQIGQLDLIARTVVDGFVAGLHRSPDFGFSQEFTEYRAYTPGDDLRHVDWNVFSRTGKAFLKRYRGETNAELTVLLDSSASMNFGSHRLTKFEYAKFLTAALLYIAHLQRDAVGALIFHEAVAEFIRPSARRGHWLRVLRAVDQAAPGIQTDYARSFASLPEILTRRGMTVILSDFLTPTRPTIQAIQPLQAPGNEVILFQVLDPEELHPKLDQPVLLRDLESGEMLEVTPDYVRNEYRGRIEAHLAELKEEAGRSGLDYCLIRTDNPLDEALREYLTVRRRRF